MKSLIQYGLELWQMRNTELHGSNLQQNSYKRRTYAIQVAKELFLQGTESVPIPQHRLFHRFESMLEKPTRTIEYWIDTIRIAQQRQRELNKESQSQSSLLDYRFTAIPASIMEGQSFPSYPPHQRQSLFARSTSPIHRDRWSQQDIRRLLLCTNPNVRYRKS